MLKFHLNDCILFAVSCTSIENFSVMLDNIANCSDAKFIVKQTRHVQCSGGMEVRTQRVEMYQITEEMRHIFSSEGQQGLS